MERNFIREKCQNCAEKMFKMRFILICSLGEWVLNNSKNKVQLYNIRTKINTENESNFKRLKIKNNTKIYLTHKK